MTDENSMFGRFVTWFASALVGFFPVNDSNLGLVRVVTIQGQVVSRVNSCCETGPVSYQLQSGCQSEIEFTVLKQL
jgi:hypothetical protein